MIPQEKLPATTRALHEAFGTTTVEDIRTLTTTLTSDHVFRIVVRGVPYLLRFIRRAADPTVHFTCEKSAAEAGVAPRVWYTNIEDRISITDFIETIPFPPHDALVRIPAALRTLHALPPFPGRENHINTTCTFFMNQGPASDGFMRKFQESNILPKSERDGLVALHAQLAAAYARHDHDMVSSHNDLKPENICYDGHRPWLVDWEAAFLNDRYNDLAVMANFIVANDADEAIYLQEYFGQPPSEYQRARFFLMQQAVHLFYALGYIWLGSSGQPVNLSEPVPEFTAFHRSLWTREIDLQDKANKIIYGRVHWERLLQNTRQSSFQEALKIVG